MTLVSEGLFLFTFSFFLFYSIFLFLKSALTEMQQVSLIDSALASSGSLFGGGWNYLSSNMQQLMDSSQTPPLQTLATNPCYFHHTVVEAELHQTLSLTAYTPKVCISFWRGGIWLKGLKDWDKDRKIIQQLLSQAKQTHSEKIYIISCL